MIDKELVQTLLTNEAVRVEQKELYGVVGYIFYERRTSIENDGSPLLFPDHERVIYVLN